MSLKLALNGYPVPVTWKQFPAGETLVRIEDEGRKRTIVSAHIDLHFTGNDDIVNLMLLVDAVRNAYLVEYIYLYMPYLPYARQDRVCAPGESLSVKVVCNIINSLKFDRVFVTDVHSDVGVALLDNVVHKPQAEVAYFCAEAMRRDSTVLVSPDAGANKKVLNFAKHYGFPEVRRADKLRDPLTGAIEDTIVYSEHIGSKNFLIVDDICDGGRTFIELAKKLRPLTDGEIYLYVTHGIFSQGLPALGAVIDRIYCSNNMSQHSGSCLITP
jgi:ribose-phosphate pyrophosphokinase